MLHKDRGRFGFALHGVPNAQYTAEHILNAQQIR